MGEKIGERLTEVTAQPRITPKTIPVPEPEKVEEKEKEPVKVS